MITAVAMSVLAQGVLLPEDLAKQVDPKRMRAVVEKLASWHDRNTNNPTLTEAANWMADQYRQIPGLKVEIMKYTLPKMARVPEEKEVVQVVAILPGETDRKIIVSGHIDTINMVERGLGGHAPGANDDASGASVALEIARVLSQKKWKNTLVFCAVSGEEQGLYGSKALAERAVKENWRIDAMLNNDIVGSSSNKNGQKDDKHIRVFSTDPAVPVRGETPARTQESRELARLIEFVNRKAVSNFGIKLVFRADRFGRGGDHTPFWQAGYSSVRFTEPNEEYSRQHTPDDLPEFVDWKYLGNVAKMNLIAMANLADADEPPTNVRVDRTQGHDIKITWKAIPGARYTVYWRDTTSPVWEGSVRVGEASSYEAKKMSKDDLVFAVGAVGGIPVEAK